MELDPRWLAITEALAERRYPGLGEKALMEAVRARSDAYTKERSFSIKRLAKQPAEKRRDLFARLRFFLPRDLMKIQFPLRELHYAGLLPEREWRVLDIGCGLGTTTLGAAAVAAELFDKPPKLQVRALDQDHVAVAIFSELTALAQREEGLVADIRLQEREADVRELPNGRFDLILLGLVMNELDLEERRTLLEQCAARLDDGGAIVILEPALKEVTRDLHRLRDDLPAGLRVFGPCLTSKPCPMLEGDRDWCHEDRAFRLPKKLERVARGASLRYERLTFSYLTLRRDDATLAQSLRGEGWERVVSQTLRTKGKRELFVCGESGRRKLRILDREVTEANCALAEASRGTALQLETDAERIRKDDVVAAVNPGSKGEPR